MSIKLRLNICEKGALFFFFFLIENKGQGTRLFGLKSRKINQEQMLALAHSLSLSFRSPCPKKELLTIPCGRDACLCST